MRFAPRSESRLFAAFLLLTGGLYAAFARTRPVGLCIDDSLYILAARSLLHGHYINNLLPSRPPLTDPLPGFPLLLAPFVAAVHGHWHWLTALSMACTLLTSLGLWNWMRPLAAPLRWLAIPLFAWNPITVQVSSLVVSEPAFLMVVLGVFWMMSRLKPDAPMSNLMLLGVLAGWSALIRPQGAVLFAAIGIGLAYAGRWKALWGVLAVGVVIWGSVLLRNHIVAHTATGYFQHWQATLPALAQHPGLLWRNAMSVGRTFIDDNILAIGRPMSGPAKAGELAIGGWLLYCAARGVGALAAEAGAPAVAAMAMFGFFYVLLHTLWLAVDAHYFFPLVPFLLILALSGARRHRLAFVVTVIGATVLLARYVMADLALVRA
ncbi:MAG TPA: hypothetical protein VMU17_05400, partial [Elusimicrobiota bacterium]|nr:hypothetical protein [Elusimicrobiota bacterium]